MLGLTWVLESASRESDPKLDAEAARPASVLKITKKIKIASISLPPAQKTNPGRLGRHVLASGVAMNTGLAGLAIDLLLSILQKHL
jgi:hypothetical protein